MKAKTAGKKGGKSRPSLKKTSHKKGARTGKPATGKKAPPFTKKKGR